VDLHDRKYFERIGDHAQNIAEWVSTRSPAATRERAMIYYVEDDPTYAKLVVYTLKQTDWRPGLFQAGPFLAACRGRAE
jgi:hypothetical protein